MSVYLAYPNRADSATLAGGAWEATLPLTKLQTRYLTQVARSTSAAVLDTQLRADLGSDRAGRLVSLHNHNLSLAAQIRVRAWEDGGTRNGTATYVDDAGIVRTAAIDVTRHYHYIGGVRTTKLQMARTNLLLRSEEFDNASWTKTGATITANDTAAPDGATTADKIAASGASAATVGQTITAADSVDVAASFHVKPDTTSWCVLRIRDKANTLHAVWFNVTTGAQGSTANTPLNIQIEGVANGFYRISAAANMVTGGTTPEIILSAVDGDNSFTTTTGASIFAWGAQAEVGSFATSYIPTTTATASRVVDNYQRPFPYSWAEIYAAGGVSFRVEGVGGGTGQVAEARYWQIGDGAGNERFLHVRTGAGPNPRIQLGNGTSAVAVSATVNPTLGDNFVHVAEVQTQDNAGTPEARIRLLQYINGAASGSSAWTTYLDITANTTSGWSGSQTAYINSRDGNNNVGSGDFILVDTKLGTTAIAFDDPPTDDTLLNPYEGGWEDAYPDIYATGDVVDGEVVTSLKPRLEDLGGSFTRDFFHLLPAIETLRYWSVEIDDTANTDGYVQAGRLVVAPVWEPPHGMSVGASYPLDDNTKETRIRSGGYAYDSQPGGRMSDFEISLMAVERAMLLSDLRRRITPGTQFVLVDDQWGVLHRSRNSYLATLVETVPLNAAASLYLSSPFKAREEL